MAHSLTSNSFLLAPSHCSGRPLKTQRRKSSVFVAAESKRSFSFPAFRIGKEADGEAADGSKAETPSKGFKNPFNFAKVPDVQGLIPVVQPSALTFGDQRRKDTGTVFVAGATGQSGVRITQKLLQEGFKVRAGVPDLAVAQELARIAASYKVISNDELRRLNAVESQLDEPESIARAIGNASKVVVSVGPAENGPTGELTVLNALKVVQGAELAGVKHVVVIYELGAAPVSTYNVLDGLTSFFNNIFSRNQILTLSELIAKIVETNVSYTVIKANLADDSAPESKSNLIILPEGGEGANDYKVSKSRVASLVAGVFSNTAIAENKVVEAGSSSSAPERSIDELFSAIPEDGRRKAYAEAVARAKAEEEAMEETRKAQEAAKPAKKLEKPVEKPSELETTAASLAQEARERAQAVGSNLDNLFSRAKSASEDFDWKKLSAQFTNPINIKPDEFPKVQLATIRGQTKVKSLTPKKAVVKPSKPLPSVKRKTENNTDQKTEIKSVFGGLFKQETIYIDDD